MFTKWFMNMHEMGYNPWNIIALIVLVILCAFAVYHVIKVKQIGRVKDESSSDGSSAAGNGEVH